MTSAQIIKYIRCFILDYVHFNVNWQYIFTYLLYLLKVMYSWLYNSRRLDNYRDFRILRPWRNQTPLDLDLYVLGCCSRLGNDCRGFAGLDRELFCLVSQPDRLTRFGIG